MEAPIPSDVLLLHSACSSKRVKHPYVPGTAVDLVRSRPASESLGCAVTCVSRELEGSALRRIDGRLLRRVS